MGLEYDIANPRSSRLFESLRAFGYDLSTAVADLIDNSISAQARNIWVDFMWAGQTSRVLVRDDGRGMSEARLVEAMTPGSESPQELRGEADLGRFGLGMKTASISQCRCLTVITKEHGGPVVWRRWDLDYIAREGNGEWRLLKGDSLLSQADRDLLSGTCSEFFNEITDPAHPRFFWNWRVAPEASLQRVGFLGVSAKNKAFVFVRKSFKEGHCCGSIVETFPFNSHD